MCTFTSGHIFNALAKQAVTELKHLTAVCTPNLNARCSRPACLLLPWAWLGSQDSSGPLPTEPRECVHGAIHSNSNVAMLRSLARSSRRLLGRELHQRALEQFAALLGERGVNTDPIALSAHNSDWTKVYQGDAKVVLSPSCTEEVSKVLAYCNEHNISVVPQGGNTGLVGGGIAFNSDEVILSLSRMNKILGFQGVCLRHIDTCSLHRSNTGLQGTEQS